MRIVMDENVDGGRAAFAGFGEVVTLPGREIDGEDVSRADCLIVRSLTRVDRTMLGGSLVRFVGTATSGYDHVDTDWLAVRGIGFAHAPGCNGAAVADWVLAALAALARQGRHDFAHGTVGVIGAGQVGERVARRLEALGYQVRRCDPPRAEGEGSADFTDLATALASDVVTLHVPLTDQGPHRTRGLIDAAALTRMPSGAVLLNAARGGVLDEDALATRLDDGPPLSVGIDTWAGEPWIDTNLLARVALGTPHIGGHTVEGRLRGTAMVARAAALHFDQRLDWDWREVLSAAPALAPATSEDPGEAAIEGILAAYDPRGDDARLRSMLEAAPEERRAVFDRVRRAGPARREFGCYRRAADAPAVFSHAGFGQADPADEDNAWDC
ncbi:MAG: 4-phosphoerythronate dehydrogenase [Halofilum sp. (in: g-proteobacteria)]